MTRKPNLRFWHNGGPKFIRARGGQAFDTWAELGWDVDQTNHVPTRIETATWALLSCPTHPDIVAQVPGIAACPDCCVVVDVAFPFTAINHMICLPDDPDPDGTLAYWADPARRAAAVRAIEAADAVTVPVAAWPGYPEFLDDMKVFNPNTVVLPDLDGTDEKLTEYMQTLVRVWQEAVRAKRVRA